MSVDSKMTAIADTIRSYTGKSGKLGLDDMPGAINEAVAANGYDSGYSKGYAEGEASGYQNGYAEGNEDGIADGKQAENAQFWNNYLNHRTRYSLSTLFVGNGWNDDTFCPPMGTVISAKGYSNKYADQLFMNSKITDLKGICERRNVTIDLSQATRFSQILSDSTITTFPTVDTRCAPTLHNIFYAPQQLVTVEKLILKEDGSQTYNDNSFLLCVKLQNIVIEGKIGNSLKINGAPVLSKDSITSFVNALLDTASSQTLTLSKTAVESAFGSTTAAEWTALVATKSNWTISLV